MHTSYSEGADAIRSGIVICLLQDQYPRMSGGTLFCPNKIAPSIVFPIGQHCFLTCYTKVTTLTGPKDEHKATTSLLTLSFRHTQPLTLNIEY